MSSKELYRRFLSLCQKWPKDETKVGRDYAAHFREQLNREFPSAELSQVKDPKSIEETLNALERIANNKYFNENPLKKSSASGLDISIIRDSISNEGLILLKNNESSLIKKLQDSLRFSFSDYQEDEKKKKPKIK